MNSFDNKSIFVSSGSFEILGERRLTRQSLQGAFAFPLVKVKVRNQRSSKALDSLSTFRVLR